MNEVFPTTRASDTSTGCVSDAELVERARRGDTTAFGELVDRHRSAVYRAALAALHSPGDAEEVAQDAFVTAFRKIGSFRGEATFKTWLLAIAWHEALDRRKQLVRWLPWLDRGGAGERRAGNTLPGRSVASPGFDGVPTGAGSQEQALLRSELAGHLRRLIRRLPAKLRDPLLLAGSGEHSYEEIAVMLGVPTGTVKWRVAEARRHLRERLKRLGYSYE